MHARTALTLLAVAMLAVLACATPAAQARPRASGAGGPALISGQLILSASGLDGAGGAVVSQQDDAAARARASLERYQQELTSGDAAAGQAFGFAVAVSGDTAIVAAPYRDIGDNKSQGAVYVFTRSGATWTQQQMLTASDAAAEDGFGAGVAIAGDTLLIGSAQPSTGPGAAYVFVRSGATWTQQQKLTAGDGTVNSNFGQAVAFDGETAAVGAQAQPFDGKDETPGPGAVYVYTRSGGTWSLQQELTPARTATWGRFGYSLAVDGATLLVSEPGRTVGGNATQGAVHAYVRSGATWTEQQLLVQSDGGAGDIFGGQSIALEGDTALLGAATHTVGDTAQGAAYVFTREGSTWTQRQELTASDGEVRSGFGYAISIEGDRALIGALGRTVDGVVGQGAAYVFTRRGAIWAQDGDALRAPDGAPGDRFGFAVALSGGSALIAARGMTVAGVKNVGAAYVLGLPSTITASASGHGTVSPDGAQTVAYGATPLYRFTPARGYRVEAVTVDREAVSVSGSGGSYTFPAVVADHAVAASFAARPDNRPGCTVDGWSPGRQDGPVRLVFRGHLSTYGIAVAYTEYRLGDSAWKQGSRVTVRRRGVTQVRYRAVDVDGNVGVTKSRFIRIYE